jgi:hypothetical protein
MENKKSNIELDNQNKSNENNLDDLAKVSGGRKYWDENGRFIDEDGYYDSEGDFHTDSDPERL